MSFYMINPYLAGPYVRVPEDMHTSGMLAQWVFDDGGTTIEDVTGSHDIDLTVPTSQNYTWTSKGLKTEGGLIQTPSITGARTIAILYRTKRASTAGFLVSGGSASSSGTLQESVTVTETQHYGGGYGVHPLSFRSTGGQGAYELNRGGWGIYFRTMTTGYNTILGLGGRHSTTTSRCDEFEIRWAGVWNDVLTDGERTSVYESLRSWAAQSGIYLHWSDCPERVDAVIQLGESTADGKSKIVDLSAPDQAQTYPKVLMQSGNNSVNMSAPVQLVLGTNQQQTAPTTDFGPEIGLALSREADTGNTRRLAVCKFTRGSTFLGPTSTAVPPGTAPAPGWNADELPTAGLLYNALRHFQDFEQSLRASGIGAEIRGVLWLIGLNDSQSVAYTTDATIYQAYLQEFYDTWETQTNQTALKMVVVKAHNHDPASNATANGHVRTAQASFVTANSADATLYDADAVSLAADNVHFNAAGSKLIGGDTYSLLGL